MEKTDSFLCWAEILYSARKHQRWSSSDQGGAETVAHFVRADLVSLEQCIDRILPIDALLHASYATSLSGRVRLAVSYVRKEGSVVSAAEGASDASSGCGVEGRVFAIERRIG